MSDAAQIGNSAAPVHVAMTNLDLYMQLHRAGYGEADLLRVRDAYLLALRLFSDRYRASGKPFLAHLVGTASLVASFEPRAEMVLAGLLHAVYQSGIFPDGTAGMMLPQHRAIVAAAIGKEAEELVAAYQDMRWNAAESERLAQQTGALDARERDVMILRLANEIEDHLGLAMRMSGEGREEFMGAREACLAIARGLGRADIAGALAAVYRETDESPWAAALAQPHSGSFRVPAASPLGGSEHLRIGLAAALRSLRRRTFGRLLGTG